jgi:farnesol dehydrogenase
VKVLITGGTGYLGRAIVRALVARRHEPVVFARGATAAGLPGTAVDGDVRDAAALRSAARGVDAICHTAALVKVWRPNAREFDDVNVGGLEHALEAARANQIGRVVYTSSFVARPPAGCAAPIEGNDYLRTKVAADRVARRAAAEGLPIVILYPGVIFGPGIRSEGNLVGGMLADHMAGRLPGIIGAERLWSYAWVEDVAAAHVTAIERGNVGSSYQLGGENLPQITPFELLREWRGVALPRQIPAWAGVLAGTADHLRARLTGHPPRLTRLTVRIFQHDWTLDSGAAARDLGYEPTALRDGLAKMLADNDEIGPMSTGSSRS